ncbi:hypothetical protein NDU88_001820 [Pleurodeles waltl]|uniref:Uncharacterized protein n=1 Tax=Pleurodeles waltl TaxID=8319 RepID=A0AAV7UTT7_PLEWA|nr:hypothetical protein NDU88_001820 [Pleurodeles waltl]
MIHERLFPRADWSKSSVVTFLPDDRRYPVTSGIAAVGFSSTQVFVSVACENAQKATRPSIGEPQEEINCAETERDHTNQ